MKKFFHYVLLLTVLLISCKKNRDQSFAAGPLIRSIHTTTTDVMQTGPPEELTTTTDYNFRYNNKQLIAVNNHHLFYDGNNRLGWSRMESMDSTNAPSGGWLHNHQIKKFSYKWKNGAIDEIYIDSAYNRSINSSGQIVSERLQTGIPYARFFRSANNRVDSMVYFDQFNDGGSTLFATRLFYDGDNVSKTIIHVKSIISSHETNIVFVTESLYNSIPNPLYRIYKELTILPFPLNYVPSGNYISGHKAYADIPASPIPAWNDVTYQLNGMGWPVKSEVVTPSSSYRSTTVFSYY